MKKKRKIDPYRTPREPKEPTLFQPGSPEKIEVMRQRHSKGYYLYNKKDNVEKLILGERSSMYRCLLRDYAD